MTKAITVTDAASFLTADRRTLFVAGSGVSVSAPASAPSAQRVLEGLVQAVIATRAS